MNILSINSMSVWKTMLILFTAAILPSKAIAQSVNEFHYSVLPDTSSSRTTPVVPTAADFGVTPLGGASYTIGIEAPVGQAALRPEVSISYNSQFGNGIVGWGANLSGVSVITRGPRTVYMDGKAGAVNHDNGDAFYLDGQRLVLREYVIGSDSSVYCLENSPFTRIVLHGLTGSSQNYLWFSVLDRDGVCSEFGHGGGQQTFYFSGAYRVNSWYITRRTDNRGNYMTYSYSVNNLYQYLHEITYGHNQSLYTGLTNKVEFSYENRPDTIPFSIKGVQGSIVRRLKTITTKSNETVYRTYTLNYSTGIGSNPTQVSRLISVEKSNGDESAEPILLSWQGLPAMTIQEQVLPVSTTSSNGTVDHDMSFYSGGDLNGDGLTDIFEKGYVNHFLGSSQNYHFFRIHTAYINSNGQIAFHKGAEHSFPSGYAFGTNFYQYYSVPISMDVDGDGVAEMIVPERKETPDANFVAFRFYGSCGYKDGMLFNLSTPGTKNYCYAAGDLNNDGSAEVVVIEKYQDSSYYVGGVMGAETLDSTFCRPLRFTLSNEPIDMYIADMNLDGMADIVVFHLGGYSVYWNDGTWLDSHTSTCIPSSTAYSLSVTPRRVFPGDFNGDGITDFLVTVQDDNHWYLEIGKGDGTLVHKTACTIGAYDQGSTARDDDELACYVYDMDGDGKSDVVICKAMYIASMNLFYKTYTYWMRSTGESLQQVRVSSSNRESDSSMQYYVLGDFNGDGLSELANNGYDCYNGNNADVSPTWHNYTNSAFSVAANKVSSISDGMGSTVSVAYKSLTDTSVYTKITETFPTGTSIVDCPPILHVVSSVTYNDGASGSQTEKYGYGGLKANLKGRGLLGMSYFSVSNDAQGTATKTGVMKWNSGSLTPERTYERQFLGNDSSSCEIKYTSLTPYTEKAWYTIADSTYNTDMDGNLSTIAMVYTQSTGDLLEKRERWDDGATRISRFLDYDYYNGQRLPAYIENERFLPGSGGLLTRTQIEYNSCGLKTRRVDNLYSDKPLTHQYTYDNGGNLLTEKVSGSGVTTNTKTYVYDSSKRFVTSIKESADGYNLYTSFTYDAWGNKLTESRRTTGNNPQTTTYCYDGWGFRTRTELPTGRVSTYRRGWGGSSIQCYYLLEQGTGTPWVKTWYDNKGRKTLSESYTALDVHSVHTWQYDNRGNITQDKLLTGSLQQQDDYEYDDRNRVTSFQNSEGRELAYTYGNRTVTTIDGAERSYTKTFNPRGQVMSSSDPSGAVTYTYDADGKPLTASAHGATVTIGYDERGNRESLEDPDAGTMTYTYDALGRVISQTDARNNTTEYTYDGFGNIESKEINGQPYASYTWSYSGTTAGLLMSESAGGSTISYSYDSCDRLSTKTYTLTGTTLSQPLQYEYTYGSDGLLSGLSYPGGLDVTYTYDSYGNKIRTKADGTTVWELSYYDGLVTVAEHTSQISSGIALGSDGALSELSLMDGSDLSGHLSFTYDSATGNLMSRGNTSGFDESYTYDNLDRLTSAGGNIYEYADNGNLIYKTGIGHYTYDSARPHAVTSIENTERLMAESRLDTEFNAFGKISRIADDADGLNIEFLYGPDEERYCTILRRANGNLKRQVVYLDNLDIVLSSNGSYQWFYYVDDHVISKKVDNGSFIHYFTFTDQVGSILKAVDTNGTERFSATYDAWGRQTVTLNELGLIRGYTGHEMLADFGLINMNGRVYDPLLGRFLSTDNFVQEPNSTQNFNRYSYCLNNPLKYTDPSGELFGIDDFLIIVASGALVGGALNVVSNYNNIKSVGDFFGYFGVGALAGGAGAALSTVSFGVGGAIGGALTGFTSGAALGSILGGGNSILQHGNFSHFWDDAFSGAAIGAASGAVLGGVTGGLAAHSEGKTFWTGRDKMVSLDIKPFEPVSFESNYALELHPLNYTEIQNNVTYELNINTNHADHVISSMDSNVSYFSRPQIKGYNNAILDTKTDTYHVFPKDFDSEIVKHGIMKYYGNSSAFVAPGKVNSHLGMYTIMMNNKTGIIYHRFFYKVENLHKFKINNTPFFSYP